MNEIINDESGKPSKELGLQYEAQNIGALIFAKARELGLER